MLKNKAVLGSMALVVVIIGIFVLKGISPKEANPDYDEQMLADTEDLLPNEASSEKTVKGSCNIIDQASTCVEYFGSYWTSETINLVCQEGVASSDRCPEQHLGGCHMNPESESDMITWHYDIGGGGYNQENIQYAIQSCNSIPGGVWAEED